MSANDYQVGGNHYAKGGAFQHWDLIEDNGIGYIEGCATKYVTRWRDKAEPLKDLNKAKHYVVKLLELHRIGGRQPRGCASEEDIARFCVANNVTDPWEQAVVEVLCTEWTEGELLNVLETIQLLIDREFPDAPVE